MKSIYKKVQVHYPVKRPDVKREYKKTSDEQRAARSLAVSIADEISGFSPLEKKITTLIGAKNTNKAQKILRKRMGSHRRAINKINKLTKMFLGE